MGISKVCWTPITRLPVSASFSCWSAVASRFFLRVLDMDMPTGSLISYWNPWYAASISLLLYYWSPKLAYCVAQICVIFSIKPATRKLLFSDRNHTPHHLAYVEWFTPFQTTPKPNTGLYKVSRSFQQNARVASIVPVKDIVQSIHLSPLPGRSMPPEWNSHSVLEECNTFLVNSFTDYHTYLLFHSSS